jgi:hypothetical protein
LLAAVAKLTRSDACFKGHVCCSMVAKVIHVNKLQCRFHACFSQLAPSLFKDLVALG